MSKAANALKPYLSRDSGKTVGKLLLCTVEGDIHDIGKNILRSLLEASGIEVIDLGVDVAPNAIIDAVKEHNISVLAMSGVLILAIDSMKATVDALKEAGLRDKVKVIIGGASVTADFCKIVEADAWSVNATEGVSICRKWLHATL
jgi:methanogenic corrinoid protein MtbC1